MAIELRGFDVLYPDPELTFTTKMADIPLAIQEKIFGNEIDDNGVLIRTSTDKPPYFAVADEGENGFTAESGATFLSSVYTPSFTP